ncbi:integrase catalytic domain-containing protein [Trichonephila clavipes]|nr:integrase catalytic domain-containing protein [Trichonephila clavipes]
MGQSTPGIYRQKDTSMNIVTMLSQEDIPVSSLWDLEMLGIRDTIEQNSREKEKAASHFLETVRQKEDGRYEVHMPWKVIGLLTDNYTSGRAFLQISLHEKDRDFVRFLWYDNEGNIRTYRHARVAFGVTSSPFLLMAVINYHLLKESVKERYSEEFLKKLQDSFYVDNCVTSVQNNAELRIFVESATNVMKEGMFDLRGWESSWPFFRNSVKHALKISNIKTYFWTDSSTVLTWIIRREQWSVFVANRISEIRKLTTSEDWFHISTDQNPADILSRGCGPKQLQKRKWWQGPDWLKIRRNSGRNQLAVHLWNWLTSLSTTDFIQAMRRFIARRGRISVMYSDNGTNFTGLNNALRQLDWTTIESEFRVHETTLEV